MSNNDDLYKHLLSPDLFKIYNDKISLSYEEDTIYTRADIIFSMSPYPRIHLFAVEDLNLGEGFEEREKPSLLDYDISLDEYLLSESGGEITYNDDNNIDGFRIFLDEIKSETTLVDEVVIFIFNCSHIGSTYLNNKEYMFEYDDWKVEFKFRPDKDTTKHYDNLKRNRSYDITHVGTISKKSNESFKTDEINNLVENVEWYLSFGSGQSVFIPIQLGFKEGRKVWEKYTMKNDRQSHFQDVHGWVPFGDIENFNTCFSRVATKLNEEVWEDVLKITLNWYLEIKSTSFTENAIISTQVSLEQLAWTYLVSQELILEKDAYKKLRFSDILKLLCYQLNISREIIVPLSEELIENYKNDGVFMFVDFRNNFVHPVKKKNFYKVDTDSKYTVYLQGMYFLEETIKSICGYESEMITPWYRR